MAFHVGMKVVCIHEFIRTAFMEETPIVGRTYTISAVCCDGKYVGLRLHEIINPPHPYKNGINECTFESIGFRPVIERKTDISIFQRMLTPTEPVKVQ